MLYISVTPLECVFHRKSSEEQSDRAGGVPDAWATAVHGVVPCRRSHLDQRVCPGLPADDHRRGSCYLLLYQVRGQRSEVINICGFRSLGSSLVKCRIQLCCGVCFRDKSKLPLTPVLSSVMHLMRYHLGTVAKGAFIITLVEIPRLTLTYIHNQLKGSVSPARLR